MRTPRRFRKLEFLVALAATFAFVAAPAAAGTIYAGPFGSQGQYYVNSTCAPAIDTSLCVPVVMHEGESMSFQNLDVDVHDVQSNGKRPDRLDANGNPQAGSAPWCYASDTDPGVFPRFQCPLFYSDLIGFTDSAAVHGVEDLAVGEYEFYCSVHSWMRGRLDVVQGG